MRNLILTLSLLVSQSVAQVPVGHHQIRPILIPRNQALYQQILKNNPKIDSTYAARLSNLIADASRNHGIPAKIYAAILMQESAYNLSAQNKTCGLKGLDSEETSCVITDFGISQIHYKNLKRFGLDKKLLVTDLQYSIDAGAKVLATYSRFSKTEPKTWYARYNCGTKSKSYKREVCLIYKSRVDRYL